MGKPQIGLLGHRNDAQIERLRDALTTRGAEPVRFDLTDIPAHVNFHWDGESLRFGDIELGDFAATYARAAHFPMPVFLPGQSADVSEAATFPVRETGSLLNAIVEELARRRPMINPLASHRFHRMKPLLYRTLQRGGVAVPEFVVGSSLEAAAHFVDRHGECVVVKPLMGGEVHVADFDYLREHHEEVERRPLLLQRRITGRSLRAYVVAGRVVATAEVVHGDVVDWRRDVQAMRPVDLPPSAQQTVARAAQLLEHVFAGVDLEVEPGGEDRPWVIDVNPAPMFAGFELRSGLDVAGPLAETLIEAATTGRLPDGKEMAP